MRYRNLVLLMSNIIDLRPTESDALTFADNIYLQYIRAQQQQQQALLNEIAKSIQEMMKMNH